MAKTKISEYSSTANSNTDVGGINIDEGCAPSGINDAIRTLMAQLKNFQTGASGDAVTVGGVLTVTGGSAAAPAITTSGDTNTGVFFPAADTVGIATGGTERVRVDSSGNLGLGVTPSAWSGAVPSVLQVGTGASVYSTSVSQFSTQANTYYNGGFKYIGTGYATQYQQDTGKHAWYTAPSGTAGNAISFTQAMTLDASGNLMVGRTSTTYKLDVKGNAGIRAIDTDDLRSLVLTPNSGGDAAFVESSSANGLVLRANNASGFIGFTTGGTTERARIDSSGNVGIGTTSPAAKLDISGAGNNIVSIRSSSNGEGTLYLGNAGTGVKGNIVARDVLTFHTTTSSTPVATDTERARIDSSGNMMWGTTSAINSGKLSVSFSSAVNNGLVFQDSNAGGGTQLQFRNSGGTIVGSITQNGSNTTYSTSSDYRLKENVQPMVGALTTVAQLKPCTYTWKESGESSQGFIAHELQAVVPDAVTGEKDAVNEDGSIKPQGIDTSFLVATLTAAIQEQQAIIESLKARLDAANL